MRAISSTGLVAGIVRSISRTSKGSLRSFSSNSPPSPASAATTRSGVVSRMCLIPRRTTAWSSAISTLIGFIALLVRYRNGYFGSRARGTPDAQLAAEHDYALPHAEQTERLPFSSPVHVKSASIVLYLEVEMRCVEPDGDLNFLGPGVARDVCQRLLQD